MKKGRANLGSRAKHSAVLDFLEREDYSSLNPPDPLALMQEWVQGTLHR